MAESVPAAGTIESSPASEGHDSTAVSAVLDDWTEEKVRSTASAIIKELAPSTEPVCEPDSRLVEDLGYHSLALLELAFTLEDEFDLDPIDEETARGITTVRDVEETILRMLAETKAA